MSTTALRAIAFASLFVTYVPAGHVARAAETRGPRIEILLRAARRPAPMLTAEETRELGRMRDPGGDAVAAKDRPERQIERTRSAAGSSVTVPSPTDAPASSPERGGQLVVERLGEDRDGNGSDDARMVRSTEYDPQGYVVRITEENDRLGNGSVTDRTIHDYAYDAQHHLMELKSSFDGGAEGPVYNRRRETYVRDLRGRPMSWTLEEDDGADGDIDWRFTLTSEYERELVREVYESDYEPVDGSLSYRLVRSYTYGPTGFVATIVDEDDWEADGAIDARFVQTFELDRPDAFRATYFFDYAFDAVYDWRLFVTGTLNPQGLIESVVFDDDVDADGALDSRLVSTALWDAHGQLLVETGEQDMGLDGTIDAHWRYAYAYDRDGHLVEADAEFQDPSQLSQGSIRTLAYSDQGHPAEQIEESTFDGVLIRREHHSFVYDQRGEIVQEAHEIDLGGDGTLDFRRWRNVETQGPPRPPVLRSIAANEGLRAPFASPNPFRGAASVTWRLTEPSRVEVRIHDAQGRLVRTLANGPLAPGDHRWTWDGRDESGKAAARGAYFVRLRSPGRLVQLRLVRL